MVRALSFAVAASIATLGCMETRVVLVPLPAPPPAAEPRCVVEPEAARVEPPEPASRHDVEIACSAERRKEEELEARGKGPRHPDRVAQQARVDACNQLLQERAPRCVLARLAVAEVEARGEGKRHPERKVAEARAKSCMAAPP